MSRIAMHPIVLPILLASILLGGCSVSLSRNTYPSKALASAKRLDPNTAPVKFKLTHTDPNAINCKMLSRARIESPSVISLRYNNFYYDLLHMIVVAGQVPRGSEYPVWIDTGADASLTNGLTLIENDFEIYPFSHGGKTLPCGVTYAPELVIGTAKFSNVPFYYLDQQWEVRILNRPVWQQRGFLLGIDVLRRFSYVRMDNPHRTLSLCRDMDFTPDDADAWDKYPFEIKRDKLKSVRIFVTMPVGSDAREVIFDTCGHNWLVVSRKFWDDICAPVKKSKIRDSSFTSGFIGKLPCERVTVKNFRLGNRVVKKDEIIILPDNSPYPPNVIGINYFKDTEMVLDFKKKLMWIKK